MRLGIGLGLFKSGLISAGVRIFSAFQTRVINDGGTVEAGTCVVNAINSSALLQQASLLLIPSGYKGGKLYAEIPTNGNGDLTWTRGGDGFRTNASGLIQRVPWNLVQQSEDFSNAAWTKTNVTVSANSTSAPNGTTTAESIIENTSNSSHLSYNATIISAIAGAYTFSVYMKKNTRTYGFIQIATDTASKRYTIVVDLNSGSITSTTSFGTPINTSNSVTDFGDGWYRISVTATNTSGGLYGIFGLSDSANPTFNSTAEPTYTGNGTSGIYIWGAQLVEGTTAQTYLPTTDRLNFPRLDYTYGSCPAVLLEPQRTNLCLYSEEFTNTHWQSGITSSVTANSTTAPDGTTTADTAVINATYINAARSIVPSITNGTIYTLSFYAKSSATSGASNVRLSVNNTSTWTGAVSTKVALTSSWQRITLSWTSNGTQAYFIIGSVDNTGAADTTCYGNIDIWGAQFE